MARGGNEGKRGKERKREKPHTWKGVGLIGAPVSRGWLVSWETKMNPAECVKKK